MLYSRMELAPANPAVERFLRMSVADGDASPRTIAAYRQNIAFYLRWAAGNGLDPLQARHDDILTYRSSLVAQYRRATIKLRLTAARLFYRSLVRWGSRPDNPAEGIRAPRERESAASNILSKSITPDEAKTLLAHARQDRDGAMIRLMVYHGLRCGEVSRLTHEDLSQDRTRLSVPGKGSKRRMIILSYRCREDMSRAQPGPLFKRRGGGMLSVRSIEAAVNRAMESIGIKQAGKSAHALRHVHGLISIMGGASREALADEMGHADAKTQDIYIRAAAAYQSNPADAVERMLK